MSRFAHLASSLPVGTTRYNTNTASVATAGQPVLTTINSTTDFVTDLGGGSHTAQINLQLRTPNGAIQGGQVHVAVNAGATTMGNNAFTATTGALYSPNNGATLPVAYSVEAFTNQNGKLTLNVVLAGASASAQFVITYGTYQLVVTKAIA